MTVAFPQSKGALRQKKGKERGKKGMLILELCSTDKH